MIRNNKGSAIVWAVVSMLIIMVLSVGLFGVSASYFNRSLDDTNERQAYLAARSAVEMILTYVDSYKADIHFHTDEDGNIIDGEVSEEEVWQTITEDNPLIPEDIASPVIITDIDFGTDIADVTAHIERRSEDIWVVSATASYGKATETVTAVLRLTKTATQAGLGTITVPDRESLKDVFHGVLAENVEMESNGIAVSDTLVNNTVFYLNNTNAYIGGINRTSFLFVATYARVIKLNGGNFYTKLKIDNPIIRPYDRRLYPDSSTGHYLYVDNETLFDSEDRLRYFGGLENFNAVFQPIYGLKNAMNGGIDFTDGLDNISNLNAGSHFRRVTSSANLNLSNVKGDTELYIFIESGTLTLQSANLASKVFIYGKAGTKVVMEKDTILTGALIIPSLQLVGTTAFTINYSEPSSDVKIGFTNGGTEMQVEQDGYYTYKWGFEKYE